MLVKILRCRKREAGRTRSEDAAGGDVGRGLFAVADGAGSGSYADKWASVLVNYAVEFPLRSSAPAEVSHWLNRARSRFIAEVPPVDPDTLPPHMRGTARRGAFSTFHQLRCIVDQSDGLSIQCLSLGDTCTFLIRGGTQRIEMHPEKTDSDFDQAPHLLTTSAEEFNPYLRRVEEGMFRRLRPGDVLIVATDAVARWIVAHASDSEAMNDLLSVPNDERWLDWVERRRNMNAIGNDDSTLVVLGIQEDDMSTMPPAQITIDPARLAELQNVIDSGDSIVIAEVWGDGSAFSDESHRAFQGRVETHLEIYEAVQHMRGVLNAYYQQAVSLGEVEQEWLRWGGRLKNAQSGAGIRKLVRAIGITSAELETNS